MTCHCLHSVVLCSLEQRTKNILLLFLSKQNKTTKCKNKKQVFVFFFVSPWDMSYVFVCQPQDMLLQHVAWGG